MCLVSPSSSSQHQFFQEHYQDGPIPWFPLRFYDTKTSRARALKWYMLNLLHIRNSQETMEITDTASRLADIMPYDMYSWCEPYPLSKRMQEVYPCAHITHLKKEYSSDVYPVIELEHLSCNDIEFEAEIEACLFYAERCLASILRHKILFGSQIVIDQLENGNFIDPTDALLMVNALRSMLQLPSIVRILNSPMGYFVRDPLFEVTDNAGIQKLLGIEEYKLKGGEIAFEVLDEPILWSTNCEHRDWGEKDFKIMTIPAFNPRMRHNALHKKLCDWYQAETDWSEASSHKPAVHASHEDDLMFHTDLDGSDEIHTNHAMSR
jgi:hypothetical protein